MTVISARKFLPVGLAMLLPLALAGCGNTGSGSALKNSAHLTPPPLEKSKQEKKQTAVVDADKVPGVKVPGNAEAGDVAKNRKLAAKAPKPAAKTPVKSASAQKVSPKAKPVKTAKKANTPPMPVKRPYLKVRKKVAARMIKDQKPSAKIVKKMPTKPVESAKILAKAEPVAVTPIVVEVPKVEMVPVKAVPAQVPPQETTEIILDGYIDGSGINSSHQMSAEKIDEAKLAQAQSVAEKPDFGQSEFRFSPQK